MSFNPLERQLALWLSKFPGLKQRLKFWYQGANRLLFKKSYQFYSDFSIHRLGLENTESFLGYYDHSPLPKNNDWVIFHETENNSSKAPQSNTQVSIVLQNFKSGQEIWRTSSKAYNWQQGSKMMWMDEDRFIFNDYQNEQLVSRIISVKSPEKETQIPFPIYDCESDFALSLNFDRLSAFRPDYGYRSAGISVNTESFIDEKDGIFHINLKTLEKTLIVTLEQLAKISEAKFQKNEQWVNHIMISPNGKKFMFLHRWIENGVKRDALYVANSDGSELKCLINEGMVSHCFWKNDDEIIGYLRSQQFGDCYHHIDLKTLHFSKIEFPNAAFFGDGHPSVFGEKMLFDTYPDRAGMKQLLLFDFKTQELKKLGSFYEPLQYFGESRCDLHPRFSMDGKLIFFDSVHKNKRGLYYLNLEEKS